MGIPPGDVGSIVVQKGVFKVVITVAHPTQGGCGAVPEPPLLLEPDWPPGAGGLLPGAPGVGTPITTVGMPPFDAAGMVVQNEEAAVVVTVAHPTQGMGAIVGGFVLNRVSLSNTCPKEGMRPT